MADVSHQQQTDLMGRLVRELERRTRAPEHDAEVARLVDQVGQALLRPVRTGREWAPPKRVATAMALALHSAPHFVATLPRPVRAGSVDPGEPDRRTADLLPVVTNEVLERALGVGQWESEELREEVDRRAGKALKQVRTVNWLWSHFGQGATAQTLGRILFPGASESVDLARRGGHLYLLTEQREPTSRFAGWLPWLGPDAANGAPAFESRAVDRGLRNRIARGVGADDDEVIELLDAMVCLVARGDAAARLQLDGWRSYGYAAVTDLGLPYTAGDWLVRAVPPDGADWRAWIRAGQDGLELKAAPEKVFDALALPRVAAMTRLLYAALLAAADRDGRTTPATRPEDVDLFDVPRHVRAALAPLLAWAGRTATHKHLARETGRPVDEVAALLERVREAWIAHAGTSWYGPPGTRTPSIQTLLLEHVVVLSASLRQLLRREPDPRSEHGDLVLLFVAHYLREARLERLWVKSLSDCAEDDAGKIPPPEDIAGHWFWRAWSRLLDEVEHEGGSTTGY